MAITLSYSDAVGAGDITFSSGSIATGDQLQTLVYTSLFTDAYADESTLPGNLDDRRGYWGDTFLPAGESYGSHLWLISREKITPDVIKRVRDYAQQALNWLVDDGLARAVTVTAERHDLQTIALRITITTPDGAEQSMTVTL